MNSRDKQVSNRRRMSNIQKSKSRILKINLASLEINEQLSTQTIANKLKQSKAKWVTFCKRTSNFHQDRWPLMDQILNERNAKWGFSYAHLDIDQKDNLGRQFFFWYHKAISVRHLLPNFSFSLIRAPLYLNPDNLVIDRQFLLSVLEKRREKSVGIYELCLYLSLYSVPAYIEEPLITYDQVPTWYSNKRWPNIKIKKLIKKILTGDLKSFERCAPCPQNWPGYYSTFLKSHQSVFDDQKLGAIVRE